MNKCPKCNYKNDDRIKSCTLCGAKLTGSDDSAILHEPRLWQAGKPRARAERTLGGENTERHYLVPPVGEPLRLEMGAVMSIGRDETCEVRILSTTVSRRHAEVRWVDSPPRPVLRDLGSQNGTFVNEMRLESRSERGLSDGDVVRLGDLSASYRILAPGLSESSLSHGTFGETTSAMPAAGGGGGGGSGALTGDAEILPIAEVLRRLESLHANGTLYVEAGGAKGNLMIEGGRAIAGSYAGLIGSPAVAAMTALTTGRFSFEASELPRPAAASEAARVTPPPPPPPPKPAAKPAPAAKADGPPLPNAPTRRLDPQKIDVHGLPPAKQLPKPSPSTAAPPPRAAPRKPGDAGPGGT